LRRKEGIMVDALEVKVECKIKAKECEIGKVYQTKRGVKVRIVKALPGGGMAVVRLDNDRKEVPLPGDYMLDGPIDCGPRGGAIRVAKEPRGRDPRLPVAGSILRHEFRGGVTWRVRIGEGSACVLIGPDGNETACKSVSMAGWIAMGRDPEKTCNGYSFWGLTGRSPRASKPPKPPTRKTLAIGDPILVAKFEAAAGAAGMTTAAFMSKIMEAYTV
jgi:hypothetical protein